MKSVRVFLLLMVILQFCLFGLDWYKTTVAVGTFHSFLIWFQTFFLIISGWLIMKLTLQKQPFQLFTFVYGILWTFYFLLKYLILKLIFIITGSSAYLISVQTSQPLVIYLKYSQLLTPLPFLIFWLLYQVYLKSFTSDNSKLK